MAKLVRLLIIEVQTVFVDNEANTFLSADSTKQGQTVGIVVGCSAIALIVVGIIYFTKRRKTRKQSKYKKRR